MPRSKRRPGVVKGKTEKQMRLAAETAEHRAGIARVEREMRAKAAARAAHLEKLRAMAAEIKSKETPDAS